MAQYICHTYIQRGLKSVLSSIVLLMHIPTASVLDYTGKGCFMTVVFYSTASTYGCMARCIVFCA